MWCGTVALRWTVLCPAVSLISSLPNWWATFSSSLLWSSLSVSSSLCLPLDVTLTCRTTRVYICERWNSSSCLFLFESMNLFSLRQRSSVLLGPEYIFQGCITFSFFRWVVDMKHFWEVDIYIQPEFWISLNTMKTKRLSNHMSQYFNHNRT